MTTATVKTIDRIRELIVGGELGAGEPIRQEALCARLGISRTPVREAIISLQAEGLLVTHPHRGAVVFKPTADDLEEIYEIRVLLETAAAKAATPRVEPELIDRLNDLIRQMDATESPWEFARLNRQFRLDFYSCSGKNHLVSVIKSLMHKADPYVTILAGGPSRPVAAESHRELVLAIASGNAARAARITKQHLQSTVRNVLPLIKR